MDLNVFRNAVSYITEEDHTVYMTIAIVTCPIWLTAAIGMGIYEGVKSLKHRPIAKASIETVNIPEPFYKRQKAEARFSAQTPIPVAKPLTEEQDFYYKNSYKDLNLDGAISKYELSLFDENKFQQIQDDEMEVLLLKNPEFKGIVDTMNYETAWEVVNYAKNNPKNFKYILKENKDDPENLKRFLIHGLTNYTVRNSSDPKELNKRFEQEHFWGAKIDMNKNAL